jgi:hypothetical protein
MTSPAAAPIRHPPKSPKERPDYTTTLKDFQKDQAYLGRCNVLNALKLRESAYQAHLLKPDENSPKHSDNPDPDLTPDPKMSEWRDYDRSVLLVQLLANIGNRRPTEPELDEYQKLSAGLFNVRDLLPVIELMEAQPVEVQRWLRKLSFKFDVGTLRGWVDAK